MLRRIPLGKMNNLRDLGGYPAGDGVTVWERFLRGDNPKMCIRDRPGPAGLRQEAAPSWRPTARRGAG